MREGSFFEPVNGHAFDLITTNPPFVISPATEERLVYRDSGLPGDRAVEHVVTTAPDHLRPGGWCQVLANWVVARDQSWDERLAGWVRDDCDALVVQRETLDPAAYVELWLKDAGRHGGPAGARRYDEWLAWFDRQGVEAIGFGWVNLRRRRRGHRRTASSSTGPTTSSSRSVRRSRSGRPTATGCRSPMSTSSTCIWSLVTTSCRRPAGHPEPRTRSRSCCGGSAVCGAPSR